MTDFARSALALVVFVNRELRGTFILLFLKDVLRNCGGVTQEGVQRV